MRMHRYELLLNIIPADGILVNNHFIRQGTISAREKAMGGELRDGQVMLAEPREASQLHNKGWFGVPQPGGALRLELVEAVFLVESGRLVVHQDGAPVGLEQLMRTAASLQPGFEIRYLVYSDLRQRGLTVQPFLPGPPDFVLYERGAVPSRSRSRHHVLAISERGHFDVELLAGFARRAGELGKLVMLALVDEEGDLTYYDVSMADPSGTLVRGPPPARGRALMFEERALVFDEDTALRLRKAHYGRPSGKALQLSLIEVAHLEEEGALEPVSARTGRPVSHASLVRNGRAAQPDFELRLRAYRDLRRRGLVVRTGFKYGTHFRLYDTDPDNSHARYLLHAVPKGFSGGWPDISRAVRLAHGVRKEMLLARVGPGNDMVYMKLGRTRP
jgi:tRNA-intron endonuclease